VSCASSAFGHLARRVGQVVCAYRLLLGFYQEP
jgi:hypothetical protein